MDTHPSVDRLVTQEANAPEIERPRVASLRDAMDAAPLGRLQWAIAAMLTCVMVLDGLDLQLAAFSAPLLMAEWGLSKPEFGPLLAAAMIGMAVGTLIGSWAGDRFGRRPVIVASVAYFAVVTACCAAAASPTHFMGLRFLSGIGFGTVFPVAMTAMSEWMPKRAAGKALAIMTLGIPLGGLAGATAASRLLPAMGWRWCFVATGAVCLAFALLLAIRLPESPSFLALKGRHRAVRAVLGRAWGRLPGTDGDHWTLEPLAAQGSGLLRRANRRVNAGLWTAVLVTSFATYAIGGWLTVILTGLGMPLGDALRGPIVFNLAAIVGALATGSMIVRAGTRTTMVTLASASFASAAALTVAAFILAPGGMLYGSLIAVLAVAGFCSGGLQPAYYVVAAAAYETPIRARGMGLTAVLGRIGAILSSLVGGLLLAISAESGFFGVLAAMSLFALAGILVIDRHVPRGGASPT